MILPSSSGEEASLQENCPHHKRHKWLEHSEVKIHRYAHSHHQNKTSEQARATRNGFLKGGTLYCVINKSSMEYSPQQCYSLAARPRTTSPPSHCPSLPPSPFLLSVERLGPSSLTLIILSLSCILWMKMPTARTSNPVYVYKCLSHEPFCFICISVTHLYHSHETPQWGNDSRLTFPYHWLFNSFHTYGALCRVLHDTETYMHV